MNTNATKTRVAAFFDLDGTLITKPSLECRFFSFLRQRRAIPLKNYLLWLGRAAWLAPRGIEVLRHANKLYLRGLSAHVVESPDRGHPQAELSAPRFLPEGVNQVAWHARQGHAIVLVTGTLAPLAQEMALALTVRLAVRGIGARVAVCATQLEENNGIWTGRVVGGAMFRDAKARAVRRLASEENFDLSRCYAYGDSESDRPMLEAVGRPCVVNPSQEMGSLARKREWAVLAWTGQRNSAARVQTMQQRGDTMLGTGRSV